MSSGDARVTPIGRVHRSPRFGLTLLGLLALYAGPAVSQQTATPDPTAPSQQTTVAPQSATTPRAAASPQPAEAASAGALPAVNYPFPVPGTARPNIGMPRDLPLPTQFSDSDGPIPYDDVGPYEQVGGVWGYRDRNQRFHRAPASIASRLDNGRLNVITPNVVVDPRDGARPPLVTRRLSAPRSVVHLPNAAPGRIVVGRAASPDRGRTR